MEQLPEDFALGEKVYAITYYRAHTCLDTLDAGAEEDDETFPKSQATNHDDPPSVNYPDPMDFEDEVDDLKEEGTNGSSSYHKTSTARRIHSGKRAMSGVTLVKLLREEYEKERKWKEAECLSHIRDYDPNANKSMAASVLRRLKRPTIINQHHQMKLIQGAAHALSLRGFRIILHIANAAMVREQIIDTARKRYYAVCKKSGTKPVPFRKEVLAALLSKYSDEDDDGVPRKFLMGWTLVPPNMAHDNLANFMPVHAMDCAGMRNNSGGILTVRATKDAAGECFWH